MFIIINKNGYRLQIKQKNPNNTDFMFKQH